jgi:virulence-associated protein VagC
MERVTVIFEGDCQTVRLPKSIHLPAAVFVRQEGDAVVLEPAKPKVWPEGFFDSIHVTDPAFDRPQQGELPLDRAAAEKAASIRSDLERQGQSIGPYDLLIAGQALASGLTLATNNIQEFQRVGGLKLESWP